MVPTAELTRLDAAARQAQSANAAAVAVLLLRLWSQVDADNLGGPSGRAFLAAAVPLITSGRRRSSLISAANYGAVRALVLGDVAKPFTVPPLPPVPIEQLQRSLAATGFGRATVGLARAPREQPAPNEDPSYTPQRLAGDKATRARVMDRAGAAMAGAGLRHVRDGGRLTTLAAVREDKAATGYVRVTSGACCSFCAMLASRGPVYTDDSFVESDPRFIGAGKVKVHDSCVIGSTLVSGPETEVGFRRWYEGEGVVIRTASGNELTITPNHPVLTEQGWVAAGELSEGDYVLSALQGDRGLLAVPDVHQEPRVIEDHFAALAMVFGTSRRGVPVAAEEFHGDVSNGEVDVVTVDRLLADGDCPELTQPAVELALAIACAPGPAGELTARGLLEHLRLTADAPLHRLVGGSSDALAEAWIAQVLEGVDLIASAPGCASVTEDAGDDSTAYTQAQGDGVLGLATEVGEHYGSSVQGDGAWPRFDPASNQVAPEDAAGNARLGRNLRRRLATGVERDRVCDVRRVDLACHVYNLQTAEGWYAANGIIASNCACGFRAVFTRGFAEAPAFNAEMDKLWASVQKARADGDERFKGADPLNSFRRAYGERQLR